MWNLNRVSDVHVAQMREVRAHVNGVAPLLDGRIRHCVIEALLRIVKAEAGRPHIAMHVYFTVGTPGDIHIAGGIRKLQANRTGDVEAAVEAATYGRSRIA